MNTHLKGFGLENFRVFKDYTWFDFAPITILTGPNNSGKSSLNRGLKLMFDPDKINNSELQLGGFERVINKNSEKTHIGFKISKPYWLCNYPTIGTKTPAKSEVEVEMIDIGTSIFPFISNRIFLNDKLLLEESNDNSCYFDFETFYEGIKPFEIGEHDGTPFEFEVNE